MLPELYHAHLSHHLEDLPFWLELAAQAGGPILELGCGTGRVLVPLAQAGYRTVGIDHDPGMLNHLQENLDPLLQPKPSLITADISQFSLAKQFPLIILPCNTLSTFSDERRRECLRCVRRHLNSEGMFAVSLPNPELLSHIPSHGEVEFEDEFILPQTGNPVQVSSSMRRTRRSLTVTWNYDLLFPDGTVERMTMESSQMIIPAKTYLEELKAAGLKVDRLYGDFNRSAFTVDSPNLIILSTG